MADDPDKQAPVTPEMVHELLSHVPYDVWQGEARARHQWMADWLNKAIANPNARCPCCGVTPNQDIPDTDWPPQQAATALPEAP